MGTKGFDKYRRTSGKSIRCPHDRRGPVGGPSISRVVPVVLFSAASKDEMSGDMDPADESSDERRTSISMRYVNLWD